MALAFKYYYGSLIKNIIKYYHGSLNNMNPTLTKHDFVFLKN